MRQLSYRIEQTLDRAAGSWKWQRLIWVSSEVGMLLCAAVLLLGVAVWAGWISSGLFFGMATAGVIIAACLGWFVKCLIAMDHEPDRKLLAGSVEHVQPPLMDRLNTLVELEARQRDATGETLRRAIEQQAGSILQQAEYRNPFSVRGTVIRLMSLLAICLLTLWFYGSAQPLQTLRAAHIPESSSDDQNETLVIPPESPGRPDEEPLQVNAEPWGEIRISEPGHNLRITPAEDVPLLIEAAASRALSQVTWTTAVNNTPEQPHPLPAAEDPRYAVYQPVIQPGELGMQVWDVLRYRATAACEDGTVYESQSYFVEIIPERPKLDELDQRAMTVLEQATGLVERQQDVILNTEQLASDAEAVDGDRLDALSTEERALQTATELFDALWQHQLGPQLAEPLSSALADAREELERAAAALEQRDLERAETAELKALEHLVETRRELARLIEDHPELFRESALDEFTRRQQPTVTPETRAPNNLPMAGEELAELLRQLHKEAEETATAADGVTELARQQRQLVDKAGHRNLGQLDDLVEPQQQLQQQLQQLAKEHSLAFQDLEPELDQATSAMQQAADALQQPSADAPARTAEASEALDQLAEELQNQRQAYDFAEQQSLAQRLQENIDQYARMQAKPDTVSQSESEQASQETLALLDELKQTAQALDAQQRQQSPAASSSSEPSEPQETRDSADSPNADEGARPSNANSPQQPNDDQQPDQPQQPVDPEAPQDGQAAEEDAQAEQNANSEDSPKPEQPEQAPSPARPQSELSRQLTPEMEQSIRKQCAGVCQQPGSAGQQAAAEGLRKSLESLSGSLSRDLAKQAAAQNQQQLTRDLQRSQQKRQDLSAAREFVRQTLEQEREIQAAAANRQRAQSQYPQLEQQHNDLQQQLEEFIQQNPQSFAQSSHECQNVSSSMSQAGKMLGARSGNAPRALNQAAQELRQLDNALEQQQRADNLSQAASLRRAMQRMQAHLDQMAERPAQATQPQKQQAAEQSRQLAQQYDQLAQSLPSSPTSPNGAPSNGTRPNGAEQQAGNAEAAAPGSMRAARTPQAQQEFQEQTEQLEEAADPTRTTAAAEALQESFERLAEAFDRELPLNSASGSQQSSGQQAASDTEASRLRPTGHEAIARGLRQLDSAQRQHASRPTAQRQTLRLQRSGVAELATGIATQYGYNEQTQSVIENLDRDIAERPTPVDAETVRRLRDAIQQLQHDLSTGADDGGGGDETLRVDLSRFPPEYRDAVRAYYENLSEQP